jgi:hypothetical protein
VREVETKLQLAAMPANPPEWTPEKTPKFESLHSIDEVSSCNQCFLWSEFSYYGYRKNLVKNLEKNRQSLENHEFEIYIYIKKTVCDGYRRAT